MALRTVKDVLSEHMISRTVYEKFRSCGMPNPDLYLPATALFMWLEIVPVNHTTDIFRTRRILYEAEAVLNSLKLDDGQHCLMELPLITSMSGNRFNTNFFNQNKDLMMRRLVQILDGDGRIVFDDYLYRLFHMYKDWEELAARARMNAAMPQQFAVLFSPVAMLPFVPEMEDARSMFISFYKDFPIEENRIMDYFTWRWGDCIDQIRIEEHVPERSAKVRGKVVFKSRTYISLALDGPNFVNYQINGRQLRACAFSYWVNQ